VSALAFDLPPALEATAPPEERGIDRDAVKLLVADGRDGSLTHTRFDRLPAVLAPGDLIVVNVSATLAAAVPGRRSNGAPVRVHFATQAPELDERWRVVELRTEDGSRPHRGRAGESIALTDGDVALADREVALADREVALADREVALADREVTPTDGEVTPTDGEANLNLELVAPYASGSRLLLARFDGAMTVAELLERHGQPIRYGYVDRPWPLDAYQNVYAITPGSAEMPSAGRPLTRRLITQLVACGILIAPITLHTGVSSPEGHEPPFAEQYEVPAATARAVAATRAAGRRVIAVGTTVVRALETVARGDGTLAPGSGWTSLVIDPARGVRAVDGLITGWHEPRASHLQLLAGIAGHELLRRSYAAALERGYLWHEFGDSHLILAQ
jgi:S-adenosylmethionine:tRNA ribosyltransferase-isomerase